VGFLLVLTTGCLPAGNVEVPHHRGAKINVPHFMKQTGTYKGKSITLDVVIDEPIPQGRSLLDYRGRDIKLSAFGPKQERVSFIIRIPKDLDVPEVGRAEQVSVTFTCTQGSMMRRSSRNANGEVSKESSTPRV
jgi:hypothetical protein